MDRTVVNRFVGGLAEFPFVKDQLYCEMSKLRHFAYVLKFHLIRTWKKTSLFLVLVIGLIFPKNRFVGSCFLIVLFAGFYFIFSILL